MKCEHCGANLYLEVQYCPHCGQPNMQAKKHAEDMAKYQRDYGNTKAEVYRTSRRFSQVTVRVIILCAVILLGIILLFLRSNISHMYYDFQRKNGQKNYQTNSDTLDKCMENQDYISLALFSRMKYLNSGDKYTVKYGSLIRSADYYNRFLEDFSNLFRDDNTDVSLTVSQLSDVLDYFYSHANPENYYSWEEPPTEQVLSAYEQMKENMNAILHGYLGMPDDVLEQFPSLSQTKRAYYLEEYILQYTEKTAKEDTDS